MISHSPLASLSSHIFMISGFCSGVPHNLIKNALLRSAYWLPPIKTQPGGRIKALSLAHIPFRPVNPMATSVKLRYPNKFHKCRTLPSPPSLPPSISPVCVPPSFILSPQPHRCTHPTPLSATGWLRAGGREYHVSDPLLPLNL